jgi:hypothetical protein
MLGERIGLLNRLIYRRARLRLRDPLRVWAYRFREDVEHGREEGISDSGVIDPGLKISDLGAVV